VLLLFCAVLARGLKLPLRLFLCTDFLSSHPSIRCLLSRLHNVACIRGAARTAAAGPGGVCCCLEPRAMLLAASNSLRTPHCPCWAAGGRDRSGAGPCPLRPDSSAVIRPSGAYCNGTLVGGARACSCLWPSPGYACSGAAGCSGAVDGALWGRASLGAAVPGAAAACARPVRPAKPAALVLPIAGLSFPGGAAGWRAAFANCTRARRERTAGGLASGSVLGWILVPMLAGVAATACSCSVQLE